VEITNTPPDTVTTAPQPPAATVKPQTAPAKNDLKEKTISIAKELKLDPAEVFDKFSLEQQELYGLICRIKELHFKRLLSENQAEFETLSSTIQTETLNVSKPAAKNWVVEQLNKLTIDSVNYKIRLLESLQRLDFNAKRKVTLHWLNRLAGRLSKNAQ
jgi:hypothetical protein